MRAMVLQRPGTPLRLEPDWPLREPGPAEVAVRVLACGVCRTDRHIVDGELVPSKLPLVPGHEVIGEVVATGSQVRSVRVGDRVGVSWLGWTCGECE